MEDAKVVLLDFPINRGAQAFSIEDAILEDPDFDDKIVIFTWRTKPTIMIGRFQSTISEVNLKALEEHDVDLVRRATGGGTIFTDDGCFQFSLIAPRKMPDGNYQKAINFERFLNPSHHVFNQMGIECEISSRNDMLHKGIKFNGNSQHINKDKILYHGSVLYSTDLTAMDKLLTPQKLKLKSKGIKSTRQRVINLSEVDPKKRGIKLFQREFEDLLALELASQYTTFKVDAIDLVHRISNLEKEKPSLFELAKHIQETKYDNEEWNFIKTPPFNMQKEKMLDGGFVKCSLDVQNGLVASINLEGDFFIAEDVLEEKLKEFKGKKYTKEGLHEAVLSLCDGELFKFDYDEIMELLF